MADERIPIDYDTIATQTDLAWCLRIDREVVWLPKSQCSLEVAEDGGSYALVPEWLAYEKGLI